jgi:hypothetical protein
MRVITREPSKRRAHGIGLATDSLAVMARRPLTADIAGERVAVAGSTDRTARQAETFYRHVLEALAARDVPFLVGGGFAMAHYTGIRRPLKDLDLFVTRTALDKALAVVEDAGYSTDLTHPHFLAKALAPPFFVDIIFSSGNGVCAVDEGWFEHAPHARILDLPVRLCPIEETIWSKAFVMERERFDGHDIAHLIRAAGRAIDWPRLLARFDGNWPVLLAHLILFGFIYPGARDAVPSWLLDSLVARLQQAPALSESMLCRGTMLSRSQYLDDVDRLHMIDGRTYPRRHMNVDEIARWTQAMYAREPRPVVRSPVRRRVSVLRERRR